MTITLSLPPEIEQQLYQRAAAEGVPAETIVLGALAEQFDRPPAHQTDVACLPPEEARLLEAINQGFPNHFWDRYRTLVDKRRAESLTESEHAELIALYDQIEIAHAKRLEHVIELARLRNVSPKDVMRQLGLGNPGYE
jgi:hypothetical protein